MCFNFIDMFCFYLMQKQLFSTNCQRLESAGHCFVVYSVTLIPNIWPGRLFLKGIPVSGLSGYFDTKYLVGPFARLYDRISGLCITGTKTINIKEQDSDYPDPRTFTGGTWLAWLLVLLLLAKTMDDDEKSPLPSPPRRCCWSELDSSSPSQNPLPGFIACPTT